MLRFRVFVTENKWLRRTDRNIVTVLGWPTPPAGGCTRGRLHRRQRCAPHRRTRSNTRSHRHGMWRSEGRCPGATPSAFCPRTRKSPGPLPSAKRPPMIADRRALQCGLHCGRGSTMEIIQVVLDTKLLQAADLAAKRQKVNRSALIRQALEQHLKRLRALELEEQD